MRIVHSERKSDAQTVHDRLYAYNCSRTGQTPQTILLPDTPHRSSFLIQADDSDEIHGGLVYHLLDKVCKVDFLWISDSLRGQGAGTALLDKLKQKLPEYGCRSITLFTMGFQAPGFYPKAGFTLTQVTEPTEKAPYRTYYYRYDLEETSPAPECRTR